MGLWKHTFGERICPICGNTFIASQAVSKYCGGTCQVKSYQKKYEHVRKRRQTTFCYCPVCNLELIGSKSLKSDKDKVTFKCKKCTALSVWDFDTPSPVLLKSQRVSGKMYAA